MRAALRIDEANKASSETLTQTLEEINFSNHNWKVVKSMELLEPTRDSIWDLFEQNMKDKYINSSFGWNPDEKKEELFHYDARYILLYSVGEDEDLVGYTGFRFEIEGDDAVVYCYELQLSKSVQRQGLGRSLMHSLGSLASHFGMDKVMLTVFKSNEQASRFYRSVGFTPDESYEVEDPEEEEDYLVMSKTYSSSQ